MACAIFSCGRWDLVPRPGIGSTGLWPLDPQGSPQSAMTVSHQTSLVFGDRDNVGGPVQGVCGVPPSLGLSDRIRCRGEVPFPA